MMLLVLTVLITVLASTVFSGKPLTREECLPYFCGVRPYGTYSRGAKIEPNGYTPIGFWYFGRHGTRTPAAEVMNVMTEVLPGLAGAISEKSAEGNDPLPEDTIAAMKKWDSSLYGAGSARFLLDEGKQEVVEIGARFKTHYPDFFGADTKQYKLYSTNEDRTADSVTAFAKGMGLGVDLPVFRVNREEDNFLQFYDSPGKLDRGSGKRGAKFDDTHLLPMIERIRKRLGLPNLTWLQIKAMYYACTSSTPTVAGNNTVSAWCGAFIEEDMKVYTYTEDFSLHGKHGYGNIKRKETSVVFARIMKDFEQIIKDGATEPSVRAHFAHSGGILQMAVQLGLFNEIKMNPDDYENTKDNYSWKLSEIAGFSVNIAFVLYRDTKQDDKYFVGMYYNEVPMRFTFEKYNDGFLCPLDIFKAAVLEN